MVKSVLEAFRELDNSTRHTLADIASPMMLAFAALRIADEIAGIERLTVEAIVACLEAAGVAVKKNAVSKALARAGNRVSVNKNAYDEVQYNLMTKGRREVELLLSAGSLEVVRIAGDRPRSTRMMLSGLLDNLRGLVRICDPYYGQRTLDALDSIPQSCKVRFLTARTNEQGRKLTNAIRDFGHERPEIDFRLAVPASDLHDRYVLTTDRLLIIGHGIKDIGAKESFVIRLEKELIPDLIKETRAAFDKRWSNAQPL